jgi:MULE transposase domain
MLLHVTTGVIVSYATSLHQPFFHCFQMKINFDVPMRYIDMVVRNLDADRDNHIQILDENNFVDGLRRFEVWLADRTFKECSTLFFQLYAIHYEFANGINPVGLICLLPNKTCDIYQRLLSAVKDVIPDADPDVILTAFKMAAKDAFQATFINITISGCHFHFCQLVLKKNRNLVNVLCMMQMMKCKDCYDVCFISPSTC